MITDRTSTRALTPSQYLVLHTNLETIIMYQTLLFVTSICNSYSHRGLHNISYHELGTNSTPMPNPSSIQTFMTQHTNLHDPAYKPSCPRIQTSMTQHTNLHDPAYKPPWPSIHTFMSQHTNLHVTPSIQTSMTQHTNLHDPAYKPSWPRIQTSMTQHTNLHDPE